MRNFFYMALGLILSACSPALAGDWGVVDMNEHINQTNFIVGNHCSGTLISVEHRIILTNEHCIENYIRHETRKVVDEDGFVVDRRVEIRKPVPVSQKEYKDHELVSSGTFTTNIIDFCKEWDLALLQMKSDNIPNYRAAKIFNGDTLLRGQTVYAIGNPMMLDATVTKGILSNVNRLIKVDGMEFPYYQVDAEIEGGSSGGSLYNSNGELIGVPAAGARGRSVGLAIPHSLVKLILEKNCFEEVYDITAESYEVCIENLEEVDED